ncbi:MAG TPA: serine hydrolase domain-containing protein [Burkholderiaceae bacterium]|nr:serine hydrolase domain-containing protein [Burkholderiaceae bacterium]
MTHLPAHLPARITARITARLATRRLLAGLMLSGLCSGMATAGPEDACSYSAQLQGVTCVVLSAGQVVHERYRHPADATTTWRLASGTKSFSGIAAAAAVQDQLLNLDDKVSDTLTEWRGDSRRTITIRQLLNLTSGLDTPAPGAGRRPSPAEAVGTPLAHPPGTRFAYGQVPFQVFAELMARKLRGERYDAYLNRRVLQPLGIRLTFPRGLPGSPAEPDWGGGGAMTARDWAQFGDWVRSGGVWQGHLLVDAHALAENFRGSEVHPGYGLTWWLHPPGHAATPPDRVSRLATDLYQPATGALAGVRVWMAAGLGKQRLYILPDHGLVAVRQTDRLWDGEQSGYSDAVFLQRLLQ